MRFSTVQAARLVGVGTATLHRWIRSGKVKAPNSARVGGVRVRLWSKEDVERIRRYKGRFYWKGRGRRSDLARKRRKRA